MKYNNIYECIKYYKENPTYDSFDLVLMHVEEVRLLNECVEQKFLLRSKFAVLQTNVEVTEEGLKYLARNRLFQLSNINNDRHNLKDSVFMNMALEIAKLGTCNRLKVGCILLREDGSIASGGYNGSLSGMRHCEPDTCNCNNRCLHTAHAEENALFFSEGPVHISYVTHEPCLVCTRMLIRRGVREVVYNKPYSSISNQEYSERKEIIDHFKVNWRQYGESNP